jgi:peptide/nickel transport system permease protein
VSEHENDAANATGGSGGAGGGDDESLGKMELSEAIDLSRRKVRPSIALAARERARDAREAAAAYTTVFAIAVRQLKKSRLARTGALSVAILVLVAVFADVLAAEVPIACRFHGTMYVMPAVARPAALDGWDIARMHAEASPGDWALNPLVPFGPTTIAGAPVATPPSSHHWLGTDGYGRDVFARLVHGARTALGAAMLAVLAYAGIGVVLGALAGFFGGIIDSLVSRLVETLTAFPAIVLVLVVQALTPHPTTYTLLLAIGITRWTEVARLVRAEVLRDSASDYVTAARALGASPLRILRRHVMPNTVAPALVASAFGVAQVVLLEASLDFLRVGLPNAVPSWGETLSEARDHAEAWWLVLFAGILVFVTVAALNLVGEALRDALDPRLRDAVAIEGGLTETRESVLPPAPAGD